ncbi:translation initiation factor 5 [Capsaspora owczarzaki ATCC 30864]|uniref:Translation initiation factor 5 n=1 Tax=Capsaspora owczarzaki (strain ATCC 30864) TaxID=595528 RepID=A0A0D2X234_CAPO3|nr:translation initiation factor 5 [Capsaspora owczarzaki ATCC 30864]KJE91864.1 translation initiation factor 5 [Capsaspora owczarzaki ATCC 30864]|eukprot:XP_004363772.1 translation initiation factor 5 [Capsaspora owczarzaki ATCC 30864]
MANVNINRAVNDAFYRYKMPRLQSKIEGKGNGIKTVIVNMSDVAKCLARPPEYTCKYFGCELGAQTQMDDKISRYVVNGAHDAEKLQTLLDGFISRFVLCKSCQNPETELLLDKAQQIWQKCAACGAKNMVDMRHKLTTFILKNPPSSGALATTKNEHESQREASKALDGSAAPSPSKKSSKHDKADKGDKAEKGEKSDKKHKHKHKEEEDEDDGDWSVDTSADAVAARRHELNATLGESVSKLTHSEELELPEKKRINIFFNFASSSTCAAKPAAGAVARTANQIQAEAERLEIKEKAAGVLVEVCFNEAILQQIPKCSQFFVKLTDENKRAQRYVLGALEALIELYRATLLPKTSHILKAMYDNDILDEAEIIRWNDKPSTKYVSEEVSKEIHKAAATFVTWLKTADEEDDDDEDDEEEGDDDDEDESEEETPAKSNGKAPASSSSSASSSSKAPAAPAPAAAAAEDDFDIDDI